MAQNHVLLDEFHTQAGHRNTANNNSSQLYANHAQDLNGYTDFFHDAPEQTFDPNFSHLAASHPHPHPTPTQHQAWQQQQQQQQSQQSQPQQPPQSSINPAFDPHSHLYGRHFSNSPVPYRDALSNGEHNRGFTSSAVDPTLVPGANHSNFTSILPSYNNLPPNSTISPSALQSHNAYTTNGSSAPQSAGFPRHANNSQHLQYSPVQANGTQSAPATRTEFLKPPRGKNVGSFILIDSKELEKATNSRNLHEFVHISDEPIEISITKTTIPSYQPRKSRKELKLLAASDRKLLDKIRKRPYNKKRRSKAVRQKLKAIATALETTFGNGPYSDTDTESSYDSDSDSDSSDEEETSPLPAIRPQAPVDAVKYDTIKSVWLSRREGTQADRIRSALGEYWEVIRTIRDRWKADSAAVKQAEETRKVGELPLLKDRVRIQREMLEIALKTALEHGHPEVIRLLGENVAFIFVLYSFLAERIKETDYASTLGNAIIELLTATTTLNTETMDKTKLSKALTLFGKRGDDRIKAKVKQIQVNAVEASKAKAKGSTPVPEKPTDKASPAKSKADTAKRPALDSNAGAKRPRADGDGGPPAKRVTSGSGTLPPGTVAVNGSKPGQKRPLSTATSSVDKLSNSSANAVAKSKTAMKPATSILSGLKASKKPGTSVGGAAKKGQVPGTAKEKNSGPPTNKPTFSFADTMANLLKPKETEPTAQQEEKRAPETEEEKAKRIRKEERRKFRVTFKPDISLCSIRYFTHDPDEEMGHDASLVRDAGDVHGEGRMFKQQQHKDRMDEDEEDDLPVEESYRDWIDPSLVDFNEMDPEVKKGNYQPFGGSVRKPVSPEQNVQEQYEANNLMVFYLDPADIPPSPREPTEVVEDSPKDPIEFGLPDAKELAKLLARANVYQPPVFQPTAPAPIPHNDLTSVLNALAGNTQVVAAAPQPSAQPATAQTDLAQLLAKLQPQAQAPAQIPQMNYTQPSQTPAQVDLGSLLAQLQPQQQQQTQQPVMPSMVQQGASYGMQATPNADLQAAWTSLFTHAQQQYAYPQAPASAPAPSQHILSQEEEFKRKRNESYEQGGNKKQKFDPLNPPNRFTKVCSFNLEGRCRKGKDCTFLHTPN